jgi:hypothetical protein
MFTARLSKDAQTALGILAPLLPPDTYLAGGSALALHLDHRQSYDLDLYTRKEFNVEQVVEFWSSKIPHAIFNATGWQTIYGKFGDTDISIFFYSYPLLEKTTQFEGVEVASVADIAAMKVEAISGRGKKRDFFDLYTICQKMQWTLLQVMELNVKKYGEKKDTLAHNLKSLTFFDDADLDTERISLEAKEWKKVKEFFLAESPSVIDHFLR